MPFKSEKQRRFLWLKHPDIAKRWAHEYPESNKGLPMRAESSDSKEKKAALAVLNNVLAKHAVMLTTSKKLSVSVINDDGTIKKSNDGLVRVELPKKHGPSYAGEESEGGEQNGPQKDLTPNSEKVLDVNNPVVAKLATVLSRALREQLEHQNAQAEGREPLPVPLNMGIKRYAIAPQLHQLPMGMQPPAPAAPQPAQNQDPNGAVGGGNNPSANPIKAFGPLSASGVINGNAAFGMKNSPDSSKTAGDGLPGWYGAEGLVTNPAGENVYGVHHGVGVRDAAPGWLARIFDRSPYVLRKNAPHVTKKLKAIKGLQVAEMPDELNFSHEGTLEPKLRHLIDTALRADSSKSAAEGGVYAFGKQAARGDMMRKLMQQMSAAAKAIPGGPGAWWDRAAPRPLARHAGVSPRDALFKLQQTLGSGSFFNKNMRFPIDGSYVPPRGSAQAGHVAKIMRATKDLPVTGAFPTGKLDAYGANTYKWGPVVDKLRNMATAGAAK